MYTALIVDDNADNRDLLETMLRGYGYEAVTANNGNQALERLAERSFDLIISDILMPHMDGFQLCREVKKSEVFQGIPFIFYTATYTDPKDEDFALSLGASYFIVKPIEPEPFLNIVQNVLNDHPAKRAEPPSASVEPEEVYLKLYNQRLIQKLERKLEQLEATSRELQAALTAKEHEIEERKAAEQEQKRLQEQLAHAQKMEAVGTLAGGVAHDLNNMLQVITGYTDMATLDSPPDNPTYENLIQVQKAAKRATDLVRQLLVFSRKSELKLQYLHLNEIISDLTKMIERLIGEHIHVVFGPGSRLRTVFADPGQIEQVIVNLCVNARDAMPQGGELTIKTRNVHLDARPADTSEGADEGDYVAIEVTDTGVGISPEVRMHMFEPFFTTKGLGKGTGLGLATIYAIVNRHHGIIDVSSEIGRGTTFSIYLPAIDGPAVKTTSHAAQRTVDSSGANRTILVAEDDEQVRSFAQAVLERAGFRVLLAEDGEQAMALFDEHADTIDLALLDVVMPKKTGRAVLDSMRVRNPSLPVLFSSGYSYEILSTEPTQVTRFDVIDKPFKAAELLWKIGSMIVETPAK